MAVPYARASDIPLEYSEDSDHMDNQDSSPATAKHYI